MRTALQNTVGSAAADADTLLERQVRIADAAASLFRRKGYEKTRVAEIASKAGLSVGSIYKHVRAKEDILALIRQTLGARYKLEVRPILGADLEPRAKLAAFVEGYLRFFERRRNGVLVMYRYMAELDRRGRGELEDGDRQITGDICDIIKEGADRGVFQVDRPDMVAHNIIGIIHVWVTQRYRFPTDFTTENYLGAQLPLIMVQLGAKGAPINGTRSTDSGTGSPGTSS